MFGGNMREKKLKWIPGRIEDAEISSDGSKVRLYLTTGGYRGEWGEYVETKVAVELSTSPESWHLS